MSKDGQKPAFPNPIGSMTAQETGSGLSKREVFAAMAMQGILTLSPDDLVRYSAEWQTVGGWVAFNAVGMADALLAELQKE